MATKTSQERLRKLRLGSVREDQKAQGFFDGRFVTKTVDSKKNYSRKEKHKNSKDYL